MMNKLILLILSAFFCFANCKLIDLSNTYITNLQLTACSSGNVISLENVTIQIGSNKKIFASGTLVTSENLESPIKAAVTLKKKTFLGWVKIPCEKRMGSCEYEDLCSYGIPSTEECPAKFKENNIPCRCPLQKGTYVLPSTKYEYDEEMSVSTGKYKGAVLIEHATATLSCYNISFTLKK